VVVILTGVKLKACLSSILLTAVRFDSTGLDWGSVKTVSSSKDLRHVEIEVDSEPRPQICVQIISLLHNTLPEYRFCILRKTQKFLHSDPKYRNESTNYLTLHKPTIVYTRSSATPFFTYGGEVNEWP